MIVQSNLVNSKSSVLGVVFRIISCSNYGEADISLSDPKNMIIISFFLSNIRFGLVQNVSMGRFFNRH